MKIYSALLKHTLLLCKGIVERFATSFSALWKSIAFKSHEEYGKFYLLVKSLWRYKNFHRKIIVFLTKLSYLQLSNEKIENILLTYHYRVCVSSDFKSILVKIKVKSHKNLTSWQSVLKSQPLNLVPCPLFEIDSLQD